MMALTMRRVWCVCVLSACVCALLSVHQVASLPYPAPSNVGYTMRVNPCSDECNGCPANRTELIVLSYQHPGTGEWLEFRRLECPLDCEDQEGGEIICEGEGNDRFCTCPPNDGCWRDRQCMSCSPQFMSVFFGDVYCCKECLHAGVILTGSLWNTVCSCAHPSVNPYYDDVTEVDGEGQGELDEEAGEQDAGSNTDAPDDDVIVSGVEEEEVDGHDDVIVSGDEEEEVDGHDDVIVSGDEEEEVDGHDDADEVGDVDSSAGAESNAEADAVAGEETLQGSLAGDEIVSTTSGPQTSDSKEQDDADELDESPETYDVVTGAAEDNSDGNGSANDDDHGNSNANRNRQTIHTGYPIHAADLIRQDPDSENRRG